MAGLYLYNPKKAGWVTGFLPKTWRNLTKLRYGAFPDEICRSDEISLEMPFPARSQLDSWNLHWIWWDLTGYCKISSNLVRFCQIWRKFHWNFAYFAVNLLDFGRFLDLQLQLNWPPSVEGQIRPIWSTTPVDSGLKFWPSDLVGSIQGWAQTQPRLTCGQA